MARVYTVILVYCILALSLFTHYACFVDSPDAIQYIRIAEQYAIGNFFEAVNSFWSPLFSWILSGFIFWDIDSFTAAKSLQLFVGTLALLGVNKLMPFNLSAFAYYLVMGSMVVFILSCAFLVLTPDLLFLTLTILYIILLKDKILLRHNKSSVIVFALAGALLYFSKSIGFIFFLSSFFLHTVALYYTERTFSASLIRKSLATLILFLLFVTPWIYVISKKEGKFTISSAASYNASIIGPVSNPDVFGEIRHPCGWQGLIPPYHAYALSAWEEPHRMKLEEWSIFSSTTNSYHYLGVFWKNILSIRSFYLGFDTGTLLCIMILFLLYQKIRLRDFFVNHTLLLLISFCLTLPYIALVVMDRYLWMNNIVIVVLFSYAFQQCIKLNKKASIVLLFVFVMLAVKKPVTEMLEAYNKGRNVFYEREAIAGYISGPIASVYSSSESAEENYIRSLLVSLFSNEKYFGMMSVEQYEKKWKDQGKEFKIEYLITCDGKYTPPDSAYVASKFFSKGELVVFKLK
jgi:hypothetical protein